MDRTNETGSERAEGVDEPATSGLQLLSEIRDALERIARIGEEMLGIHHDRFPKPPSGTAG